jgi:DNA-binding transcriptional MerR regulator
MRSLIRGQPAKTAHAGVETNRYYERRGLLLRNDRKSRNRLCQGQYAVLKTGRMTQWKPLGIYKKRDFFFRT